MSGAIVSNGGRASGESIRGVRLAAVGLMAMAMLIPVTMPVAVLRGLIHDRFGVSELATSLFMSINMIGVGLASMGAWSLSGPPS